MNASYTPTRGDVIFIDFDPARRCEIGKYRPALVLSSQQYNYLTGLLICMPISSSIRGGKLEVPIEGLEKPSIVASGMIQTLSWREREAKFVCKAKEEVMNEALARILPLIGAEQFIA